MNIIEKARDFATTAHLGQTDDEGKPYIQHCEKVAEIVSRITNDDEIIAAAWLHDTIEDTNTTLWKLEENFGRRVMELVHEVTHEGYDIVIEQQAKTGYFFPRLKSRDAMLIKFADRLHNLSRMDSWDEQRRAQYMRKSRFWRDQPPKPR
jgi:GTP diphosphokinase / guanosine-3',5'-bis(diphosphate) 3'-diphosphatase